MCWDSDINWSGLEAELDKVESIRSTNRTQSFGEVDVTEPGIAGWPSLPTHSKSGNIGGPVSLYDPTCHTIWCETRTSTASNKISGDK